MRFRGRPRPRISEQGSSVVEFALVAPLVMVVVLGVLQLGLALHVRSTMVAAAAEGARIAALSGSSLAAGERRTREVLAETLGPDVVESVDGRRMHLGPAPGIEMTVTGRLPLLGLLGPATMTVSGHALAEAPG